MLIGKIVSGGQTGVDRGALEAAYDLGFPYGGLIPKGRLAEDGIVPEKFDQMEESTRKNYLYRTEWNVVHSDATLLLSFGTELTGGTKRTVEFCKKHDKPYLVIFTANVLKVIDWLCWTCDTRSCSQSCRSEGIKGQSASEGCAQVRRPID